MVKVNQDEKDRGIDAGEKKGVDELQERIKELNCFYGISNIINDDSIPPKEALEKVLEFITDAWQYPDITCARIIVEQKEFRTDNYKETPWTMSSPLMRNGDIIGKLEVCYLEKRPRMHEGPFLKDERRLINAVSDIISKFVVSKELVKPIEKEKKEIKDSKEWEVIIDLLMKTDPRTLLRITRKMVYHLYRTQNKKITELLNTMCPLDREKDTPTWCGINMPNPRRDIEFLNMVQKRVFDVARDSLSSEEISELFHRWMREDKARPLLLKSQKVGIPFVEITDELNRFYETTGGEENLAPEDSISIRSALLSRFFTDRLEFINIAKKFITVDEFVPLLKHTIGPAQGAGKLGGKTSGFYLAKRILEEKMDDDVLENLNFPQGWYITSDTLMDLIQYNDLDEVIHLKYMDPDEIRQEQPFLEQIFKNAIFTQEIIDGLKRILRDLEGAPLIVRSSSLLEDSFGAAFSGKYKSLFLSNQGTLEERLNELTDAIAEVYASTLGPDPIQYRKEKGLLDVNEQMGILIQKVVGNRVGPYYFPAYAGVAFSRNEFRWSPRIRREDGIIRLVTGLGTRAVDRVGNDYPTLVSPKRPELKVNQIVEEKVKYSQKYMDVINLEKGIIETVEVEGILKEYGEEYPEIRDIVSIYEDGELKDPNILTDYGKSDLVVTFSRLVDNKHFISTMRRILYTLEENMGFPVDVEFASDGEDIYILQCRPQSQAQKMERVPIPDNIPKPRQVFSANRYVTTSYVKNIEYIVYVTPEGYQKLESKEKMRRVARTVSCLNEKLPRRNFILMGPGRWGSRGDIKLGVPVIYRDINNTALLVEIAKEKGDYVPELSFGTHFFQDLVEANISYLPLYPDDDNVVFNEQILTGSSNHLSELTPEFSDMEDVVKVTRICDFVDGGTLEVVMDGEANEALAYLKPPDHSLWRMNVVEKIAEELDADLYGVEAMYVLGSTKDYTAGPRSDIDVLVHFRGSEEQKEKLLNWFAEKNKELEKKNEERTGCSVQDLLDVHLITDEDIEKKTSWACHIDSPYNSAREVPLSTDK